MLGLRWWAVVLVGVVVAAGLDVHGHPLLRVPLLLRPHPLVGWARRGGVIPRRSSDPPVCAHCGQDTHQPADACLSRWQRLARHGLQMAAIAAVLVVLVVLLALAAVVAVLMDAGRTHPTCVQQGEVIVCR